MSHIRDVDMPTIRAVDATALDDAMFPDDRITCGTCARTSGKDPRDEKLCPRQPKYPSEHRHRCWYFLPQQHLEDRRAGHERYASADLETRKQLGWKG